MVKKLKNLPLMFLLILTLIISNQTFTLADAQSSIDPNILIDENFDSIKDGALPAGWQVYGTGTWKVQNGKLVADSSASGQQSRIIFGDYNWDNYMIEANVTLNSVINSARWLSAIYRCSDNGAAPYYQYALRQSGAYELAYRDVNNNWSVPYKGTSSEIKLGTTNKIKVIVNGANVKEYLNDQKVIDQNVIDNAPTGKIGFQVDQCSATFDNVKVTKVASNTPDYSKDIDNVVTHANKTNLPPQIDGKLDDGVWAKNLNLPASCVAKKANNGKPFAATFGAVWDDKYLYVAADITDDSVHEGTLWEGADEISIFFNANNSKLDKYVEPYDGQIGVAYRKDKAYLAFGSGGTNRDTSTIKSACAKTDKGWSVEVAIPFATLGIDPNTQKNIGFDVAADNDDGSTVFWSKNETFDCWRYTSGFGTLRLLPDTADTKIDVSGLAVDNTDIKLFTGQSAIITPAVLPSNASIKTVKWASSDNNVVSLDTSASGTALPETITAKAPGTAIITGTTTDGNKTVSCKVTVIDPAPKNTSTKINVLEENNFALGKQASVTINAINQASMQKNITLVLALYDSNNKMVDLVTAKETVDANSTIPLTDSISIPQAGKYTLKYFVLDDLNAMTPLSNVTVKDIN